MKGVRIGEPSHDGADRARVGRDLPLLILMVWMGTFTQTFLARDQPQNARILGRLKRSQTHPVPALAEAKRYGYRQLLPTSSEYIRVLPEIILTLMGTLPHVLEAVTNENRKGIFAPLSIAGLAAALAGAVVAYRDPGPLSRTC